MKNKTFNYIVSLIRNRIYEDVPTVSASNGQISGVSSGATPPQINDLPPVGLRKPVDLRKNKYKKLPEPYRDLFRRKSPK